MIYHIRESGVPLHACPWYMEFMRSTAAEAETMSDFIEQLLATKTGVEHSDKESAELTIKNLLKINPVGNFTVVEGSCPYIEHSLRDRDTYQPLIH